MTLLSAAFTGSFPAILMLLTIFTGIMWLLDRFKFAPARRLAAQQALAQFDSGAAQSLRASQSESEVNSARSNLEQEHLKMPWWLDYSAGFFTVILLVFILRSFVFEPFRIPSSSMMPTLQDGDLILVNKYTWGLRMPVYNTVLLETGKPDRGDVIVFRYPVDESLDYIKRVVGVPGDVVEYRDKAVYLNDQPLAVKKLPNFLDSNRMATGKVGYVQHQEETTPRVDGTQKAHGTFLIPEADGQIFGAKMHSHSDACTYLPTGIRCKVPAGHYFVMGDNRDNSQDSRYWGFVPDKNVVGKAFFIWFNFSDFKRIGSFQ